LDHPDCPPPIPGFEQQSCQDKKNMDSYNKVLVVDYVNQKLISCYT
jgi:hypothetical protein